MCNNSVVYNANANVRIVSIPTKKKKKSRQIYLLSIVLLIQQKEKYFFYPIDIKSGELLYVMQIYFTRITFKKICIPKNNFFFADCIFLQTEQILNFKRLYVFSFMFFYLSFFLSGCHCFYFNFSTNFAFIFCKMQILHCEPF